VLLVPANRSNRTERGEEKGGARMATATCNACNVRFVDDEQKRLHYRSDWHCFNLKRKVSIAPSAAALTLRAACVL